MNAFVTGGSRGIGRAIVVKLASEGLGVAFTYAGNEEGARETTRLAEEAAAGSASIRSYRLNLRNADDIDSCAEAVLGDFDEVGVVVNNAATVRDNAAVLMSNEEWDEVIAVNLSGAFYVTRAFLMQAVGNRFGRFIYINSLSAEGTSGQVNYAASKAGLTGIVKTIAKEYGRKGVTANQVTVGYVPTDMTSEHFSKELESYWLKYCPIPRVGKAEEIASYVHYLTTEPASFINGENLRIAGGLLYAP
jgi:NAD(P)-dependent dehydrogenase (short-subunit alcohol dehydrogenase family)